MRNRDHPILKPINVQMTDEIRSELDKLPGSSRAGKTREIIAAVLHAYADGDSSAVDECIMIAGLTSWKVRRSISHGKAKTWKKSVIWITERMHMQIVAAVGREVSVADFIRGAIIGAVDADLTNGISADGNELWHGDITPVASGS